MCEQKLPFDRIARDLNRSVAACKQKAVGLGLVTPPRRRGHGRGFVRGKGNRPCMCCQQIFVSEGPHNRLCGHCRNISVSPFAL